MLDLILFPLKVLLILLDLLVGKNLAVFFDSPPQAFAELLISMLLSCSTRLHS